MPGGFKALRHRCLALLDEAPGSVPWIILGGRTGTGKTLVLNRIAGSIDLEGLANHRGSAFGAASTPQPTPVSFENALAVAWLNHRHPFLLLEDESRTIGRLALPERWHGAMHQAPLVILESGMADRVAHIAAEYVAEPLAAGLSEDELAGRLGDGLDRIRRRLGGVRHRTVQALMEAGFRTGDHGAWIERLLTWYYDPMYDYQLEKKSDRVIFRGEAGSVTGFLETYRASL